MSLLTAHQRPAVDPVAERMPLGGLERWLEAPDITEIAVNGGGDVWVERRGTLEHVGTLSAATVRLAIEHLLVPLGRRLDRLSPVVDARLADGSRVCAVIPPVAVDGPLLSIRKFAVHHIAIDAFADATVQRQIRAALADRMNIVVSGATGSGKTTLLNAMLGEADHNHRIITLEDIAELRIDHPHVVRLESRPATAEGVGEVSLDQLLRTALRMRPDRLVIGEIRGAEVVPLVQALNTGHRGSCTTIHANSPHDALLRIRSLLAQHAASWPADVVNDIVGRCIDLVVHVARDGCGRRGIVATEYVSGRPS